MSRYIFLMAAVLTSFLHVAPGGAVLGADEDQRWDLMSQYLPEHAACVVVADVEGILAQPVVNEYYRPRLREALDQVNPNFELFCDAFGFDPLNDVSMVVVAAKSLGENPDTLLILVHGRFAEGQYREVFRGLSRNGKARIRFVRTEDGLREFHEARVQESKVTYWALLNRKTLIVCTEREPVANALVRGAKGDKTKLKNERFQEILSRVDTSQAVWTVLMGDALVREDGTTLAEQGLEASWGGVTIDDGVRLEMAGSVIDVENVQTMAHSLRKEMVALGVSLFKTSGERKDLALFRELVCATRVTVEDIDERPGREIVLRGNVSLDMLVESARHVEPVTSDTAQPAHDGRKLYHRVLRSTVLLASPTGRRMGTGTLVDRTARIVLTNYHVARSGKVFALFPIYRDGLLVADVKPYMERARGRSALQGTVIATDPKRDLALVRLPSVPEGADALPLAKQSAAVTDSVHTVGMGGQGILWIYTKGTVRQVAHKQIQSSYRGGHGPTQQIDAIMVLADCPINEGDSGGPLVNNHGELVGVTQGCPKWARRLSFFIDVTEVQDFLAGSDSTQPAVVFVHVPANADLQIQGVRMSKRGDVRRFTSPPLAIAKQFNYRLKATWNTNGQTVTQEKRIEFFGGETVHVHFTSSE